MNESQEKVKITFVNDEDGSEIAILEFESEEFEDIQTLAESRGISVEEFFLGALEKGAQRVLDQLSEEDEQE